MRPRCRNCGLWHPTQSCPSYGPMFPAPGKTPADYEDLRIKIQNRVAADIVAEHGGGEVDEGPVLVNRKRKKKVVTDEAQANRDAKDSNNDHHSA